MVINSKNYAFVDGQNLYMGTRSSEISRKVDLTKFKVYLQEKYQVEKAYYFLGYFTNSNLRKKNLIRYCFQIDDLHLLCTRLLVKDIFCV